MLDNSRFHMIQMIVNICIFFINSFDGIIIIVKFIHCVVRYNKRLD